MMKMMNKILISFILLVDLAGCATAYKRIVYNEKIKDNESLQIKEGLLSQEAQRISYLKDDKEYAVIKLSEPVIIAQAQQEERWGYFQFPSIGIAEQGTLVVSWQMNADTEKAYGTKTGREPVPMISKDKGKTWQPQDKKYNRYVRGYNVRLDDGRVLQVVNPKAKDMNTYKRSVKAVSKKGGTSFYRMDKLPEELQGVYLNYENPDNTVKSIHARINDPELLRASTQDLMPVVWWGNIKQQSDGALVAGVYPTYYLDSNGKVMPGSVSFYKSNDKGQSWDILGKIPFVNDGIADKLGDGCFEEPAFEILADGSFICVMRSGSTSPMYETYSTDGGKTWTTPEPFTPNGVKPMLMRLKNNVLVLASGRPGVQLRFNLDGLGKEWTDPIDMVPFMNDNGTYTRDVSCGYVSFVELDDDSFYMVYSDFTTKNEEGETRKSIMGRKVTITKK